MSLPPYVPGWRDDETVFSWCCLYHAVAGNLSARETGALLFGVEHACRGRFAPLHLRHLADWAGGALGPAAEMLTTRTPLALFWPFLPPSRRADILRELDAGSGTGWTTAIGMLASALTRTDLRYCTRCVEQDRAAFGVPRWRLSHQLPGAWVCADHGEILSIVRTRAAQWILPGRVPAEVGGAFDSALPLAATTDVVRIARLARGVATAGVIDVDAVRRAVGALLRDQGIAGWAYPLDPKRLADWFAATPLAAAVRRLRSPERRLESGRWIHDLLRARCADHPLKWMLLWAALHPSSTDADLIDSLLAPAQSGTAWAGDGQGSLWSFALDAVAARLNASSSGEAPDLKTVANQLGLSVMSVRRKLAAAGIRARAMRRDQAWERHRAQSICVIRDFIGAHVGCSRTDVHRRCKAAASWLAREAAEDLRQLLANISPRHGTQRRLALRFSDESGQAAASRDPAGDPRPLRHRCGARGARGKSLG